MTLLRYARSLTLIWWVGGALVILLLLPRLFGGDPGVPDIAAWLTTYLLPGLTLVSGAAAVSRGAEAGDAADVGAAYWVAVAASALYLLILTAAVVRVLITVGEPVDELLKPFGALLGLLQAVVIGLLGRFFIKTPSG